MFLLHGSLCVNGSQVSNVQLSDPVGSLHLPGGSRLQQDDQDDGEDDDGDDDAASDHDDFKQVDGLLNLAVLLRPTLGMKVKNLLLLCELAGPVVD